MRVSHADSDLEVRAFTRGLLRSSLSPLCGLTRSASFLLRGRGGPRFFVAGGDLTGAHQLIDQPMPPPGAYHIGGGGVVLEEALIRTLGEACERYDQALAVRHLAGSIRRASLRELADAGEDATPAEKLRFFTEAQFRRKGFPFRPFHADRPMGWLRTTSLLTGRPSWVPAQLVLIGYPPRKDGEDWIQVAVSTGGAAHTERVLALRNGLLELIQIDAAIGHWYSGATAPEIRHDDRTRPIQRLVERYFPEGLERPRFYWLPNPDLPGMSVACVFDRPGSTPSIGVGLGSGFRLLSAMYAALLEAVGVMQMAKITLFAEPQHGDDPGASGSIDPSTFTDLDRNVAYYAMPEHSDAVRRRFGGDARPRRAGDLPPDSKGDLAEDLRGVVRRFRETGKDLVAVDMTTVDVAQLGFHVIRVWSPDTLSIPLPSYPPLDHPRLQAYGGAAYEDPHPYP